VIYEKFGLTHEAVVAAARESMEAARSGAAVPAGPVPATGGLPHPTGDR
jgi:transketolase